MIRGLLDTDWIELLRVTFDSLREGGADLSDYYDADRTTPRDTSVPGRTLVREGIWRLSTTMRRFVFESPIAGAAAAAMQSREVRLYEDLLIYKDAGLDQPTPWHQDTPQWPLAGRQMSSVWLSLDPVTQEAGALRFVAGSHRGPHYIPYVPPAQRHLMERDMHLFAGGPRPDVDADPVRYPVICFDTEPGDVVIFDPSALHGAFGSARTQSRRTFSIRLLGDDVRWQPKQSVFHEWLREIHLAEGDPIDVPRFPLVWPKVTV